MNSRSRKYHESRKAEKITEKHKGKESIVEQEKKVVKPAKKNIVSAIEPSQPVLQKSSATQDDTGGGNDSGKRSDDN